MSGAAGEVPGAVRTFIPLPPRTAGREKVSVRIEVGRAWLGRGEVSGLDVGSVVEFGAGAESAVGVYVDGRCFATGELVVVGPDRPGRFGVRLLDVTRR